MTAEAGCQSGAHDDVQQHITRKPSLFQGGRLRARFGRRKIKASILAGAVGGLLGAWAMSVAARLTRRRASWATKSDLCRMEARRYVNGSDQELDSIGMVSDWIDARVFARGLSPTQKSLVAAAVHYLVGAGVGAAYGALVGAAPAVAYGAGVLFGVGESVVFESVMLPVLMHRQRDYSAGEQIRSAFDHAVYGFVLETTRRNLLRAS